MSEVDTKEEEEKEERKSRAILDMTMSILVKPIEEQFYEEEREKQRRRDALGMENSDTLKCLRRHETRNEAKYLGTGFYSNLLCEDEIAELRRNMGYHV